MKTALLGASAGSKAGQTKKSVAATTAAKRKSDALASTVASTAACAPSETEDCKKHVTATVAAGGRTKSTAGGKELVGNKPNADGPSKRKKASEISVDEAASKVKAALAAGTLAKLSIPELKVYLKSVGKPVSGKKGDLLERIMSSTEP